MSEQRLKGWWQAPPSGPWTQKRRVGHYYDNDCRALCGGKVYCFDLHALQEDTEDKCPRCVKRLVNRGKKRTLSPEHKQKMLDGRKK